LAEASGVREFVDLGGVLDQFRALPGHEAEEGMQGCEPQIPCGDGIAPFLLEGGQKVFDDLDREMLHRHLCRLGGIALGQKVKE